MSKAPRTSNRTLEVFAVWKPKDMPPHPAKRSTTCTLCGRHLMWCVLLGPRRSSVDEPLDARNNIYIASLTLPRDTDRPPSGPQRGDGARVSLAVPPKLL